MTIRQNSGIEDHVEKLEKYLGLARAAAVKPSPRADVDIEFYLQLAQKSHGKPVSAKTRQEIHELFKQSMPERIQRIQEVIRKYEDSDSKQARDQIAWYSQELSRLKAWQASKR